MSKKTKIWLAIIAVFLILVSLRKWAAILAVNSFSPNGFVM